jgi:hypothetical protein
MHCGFRGLTVRHDLFRTEASHATLFSLISDLHMKEWHISLVKVGEILRVASPFRQPCKCSPVLPFCTEKYGYRDTPRLQRQKSCAAVVATLTVFAATSAAAAARADETGGRLALHPDRPYSSKPSHI